MRVVRSFALALALIGLSSIPLPAQQTLSLNDAIRIAVENNPTLRISALEMERADEQVRQAYGSAMPNITASGRYTRMLKKQVFYLPDFQNPESGVYTPVSFGLDNSLTLGVEATQVLFNFAVFTGVGTAKVYQKASREMHRSQYNTTVAATKRSFYQVLFTKDVLSLMKATLQNAEENYKSVEALNKQGLVADFDLIRSEVAKENVRPEVTMAERNVQLAENMLKLQLGMSPERDIAVTGELLFEPADEGVLANAEQSVAENNAGIKALALQTQVREEAVTIYKSEFMPTLAAFGNYSWIKESNEIDQLTSSMIGTSQVGLTLSLNLFNGWQTSAKVGVAQVEYEQSREQLKQSTDALKTNLQNIRLRLLEAQSRVQAQGKTVEQAEKGYKIATTRYSSGTGTLLEVNDANVALSRARVNRAQAVYDYLIAKTDLEESLSVLNP